MSALQLWALGQNGELQFLHVFAQTAAPLSSITLHPSGKSILMALADGSISLWQLDTLNELYRHKHEGPVRGLTFTDTDDFYFFSGRQVLGKVAGHKSYIRIDGGRTSIGASVMDVKVFLFKACYRASLPVHCAACPSTA